VDLAAPVRGAGRVEDPLGDGGLAGVHVGEDAEVADGGEGVGAHGPCLSAGAEKGSAMSPGARRGTPPAGGGASAQTCVAGIRYRPRSGHRTPGDTRITSDRADRERGAATAAWSRMACPLTVVTVRRPRNGAAPADRRV